MASIIDMWFDNDALDALKYLRVEKAWKRIGKAIKQVENIRQELSRGDQAERQAGVLYLNMYKQK